MRRFLIAVALCAITAVSGAWTLQWNSDSSWPAGTTVNACLNGVCVNGITGNSQSFSESYSPGTVLHGTAQAIPPSGYQCGDPLTDCPPSAIAEIAQTVPSDQLPPAVSAFASESLAMANPTLDTAHVTTSTGTAAARTFSHTVPSGTNLLIVFLQGWIVGESNPPSSITFNGTNLTRITLSSGSFWHQQQGLWYLVNPTATTANIVISGGYSPLDDGGIFTAVNLSGVDTSVGTSGIRATSLSGSDARATVALSPTTSSNDLIVSYWSQQSSTSTTGQTYGGTSGTQSILASIGYNLDAVFLTSSTPTGAGQTVTFLENSTSNYPSGLAVSIAGTSGGTYSYTGSGGITTGGSVGIKRTRAANGAGGLTTSGAASLKRTFTNQAIGGITTGGAASASKSSGNIYIASGGITTGGAAALKRTQVTTPTGGITTGGAAALKRTQVATPTGGITTGGAAALKRTQVATPTGGITTGGVAALKRTQVTTPTGGITTGGAAALKRTQVTTPTGGVTTGGAAALKSTQAIAATGGVTTGGAATASKSSPGQNSYTASGGLTLGGIAALKRTQVLAATGGVAASGAAIFKRTVVQFASGGLSTSGAATFKRTRAYSALGGLTTDGAAFVTFAAGAFIHIASGGVSLGGSAVVPAWLRYVASGGLTVGGSSLAGYYPISRILPGGRLVLLSKSDRHVVLQRSDRLISLLPSDRPIIPA